MINKLVDNPKYHLIILLTILTVCIFLLLGRLYKTNSAIGGDAVYYYSTLRSIIIDKDLNLTNEYKYFHNQISPFTGNRKIPVLPDLDPQTGRMPVKYPIGSSIFLIPPFLLTHNVSVILHEVGTPVTADGYTTLYQASVAISSLLYAFLGLLLIYNLGKKIFEPKVALLATLDIWLATPLIYYMTMEPLSSQPISFFAVSLFIYLWYTTRGKNKLYPWIALGIIGGLMSIVRYQDSLFLLIPIIDQIIMFRKKIVLRLLVLLLFFGLTISIQLSLNNYFFGSPFNTGAYDVGLPYLASPKILYSLFSFQRGLLVWSPILVFALVGLYWFIKKSKLIGILLLFSFLAQLYIVSSWADPSQGDSFGNRILLNSTLIFALGLMQFLKTIKNYQKLFLVIFSLLILINAILAGLFALRIIGQPY